MFARAGARPTSFWKGSILMKINALKSALLGGEYDSRLCYIYGESAVAAQRERYAAAIDSFAALYGTDREAALYSVAGRSELSGNHTDHNHGCVIAGSIDLDIIAVAAKREDNVIRIKSEGFPEDVVDLGTFYGNTVLVGVFDHLTGQLYIIIIRQAAAVDHHRTHC